MCFVPPPWFMAKPRNIRRFTFLVLGMAVLAILTRVAFLVHGFVCSWVHITSSVLGGTRYPTLVLVLSSHLLGSTLGSFSSIETCRLLGSSWFVALSGLVSHLLDSGRDYLGLVETLHLLGSRCLSGPFGEAFYFETL